MVRLKLVWDDPKGIETVYVDSVVAVKAGANNSIIISVVVENEQIEYYCDEVFFDN